MKIGAWLVWVLVTACVSVHAALTASQTSLLAEARKSPHGILKLDERKYHELLQGPRDYGVFVQMTALHPRFRCGACALLNDPFEQVARGWKSTKRRNELVFATIDANDGMELFRRMGMTYVPVMNYFPPHVDLPEEYDLSLNGYGADDIAEFVSARIGVSFRPKKPLMPKQTAVYFIPVAFVVALVSMIKRQRSWQEVVKTLGLMACVSLVLTFTSGYMWTRIQGAPFMSFEPTGAPIYITAGFQAQYGVESLLLIALYASFVASILVLTRFAPKIESPILQRVVVVAGALALVLQYGLFAHMFSYKNPGYPFRLLL